MLYVYNIYIYAYTHIDTVDSKSKHVKVERYRSHTGRIIILDKRRITPSCASFRSVSFSRDKRVVVLSLEKKKKKRNVAVRRLFRLIIIKRYRMIKIGENESLLPSCLPSSRRRR